MRATGQFSGDGPLIAFPFFVTPAAPQGNPSLASGKT
jgi:hypothetical protein